VQKITEKAKIKARKGNNEFFISLIFIRFFSLKFLYYLGFVSAFGTQKVTLKRGPLFFLDTVSLSVDNQFLVD